MVRLFPMVSMLLALVTTTSVPGRAAAQIGVFSVGTRFELDDAVQLDRADSTVLGQLERVKAYLADRQWDEAVETLRSVMEGSEGKLIGVTGQRYVSLRDYCHLQLAALPDEALKLYRSRVDPLAKRWYEEGVARRDRRLLEDVVEQAFAGSYGDDALMALGEMAFESGDYASARWHWERIVPAELPGQGPPTWPGFPDTDLDLAAVRARLVLVSILEGSRRRARDELAQFSRLHPGTRGRLGGREVDYAGALQRLTAESASWPPAAADGDWPTFAGNALRNKTAAATVDPAAVVWRIPLEKVAASAPGLGSSEVPPRTVAEDAGATLSYHPLYCDGLVLLADRLQVRAVKIASGKPAWGDAAAIYRHPLQVGPRAAALPANTLGVPRYTATVFDGKLYARVGSPLTGRSQQSDAAIGPGYLIRLDLAAEGRLDWQIAPEPGWAFEGSPVVDEVNVYAGMRRDDIRPQAYVACFDAQTGRRRWRQFVAGAETPARGVLNQTSHNLLTLQRETLYYNTNLGAVAALRARDGRLRWVSLYPRQRRGDLLKLPGHWQRDLNPCVYHRGTLLVAPADSPRILAFDAGTGQMLWRSGTELQRAVHLLGTSEDYLIAGGDRLYWIGLEGEDRGRVKHLWPRGHEKPGYGRGILAADNVFWPTRGKIHVFDRNTARPKRVIDLTARGITGGNLMAAGGHLLIATGTELVALGRSAAAAPEPGVADAPGGTGVSPVLFRPSLADGSEQEALCESIALKRNGVSRTVKGQCRPMSHSQPPSRPSLGVVAVVQRTSTGRKSTGDTPVPPGTRTPGAF